MLRLAMSELTTYRWTFEEDVRHFEMAGFQGIGVWRDKICECGEEHGIDLLCDSDLGVSSLSWAGGFTGSDGRPQTDSIEDGLHALRLAAAMGAECLIVYTGGRGGHTHKHARRLTRKALATLGQLAEDLDVTLAVEPMHPGCGQEWTYLSNLETTFDLLDSIPGPTPKIVFDTYHLAQSPVVLERLGDMVDRIAIVQVGDARNPPQGEQDRCPIGRGSLPLREVVATLQSAGYTGYFEVELVGQEIEECNYHVLLESSRAAFDSLFEVRR